MNVNFMFADAAEDMLELDHKLISSQIAAQLVERESLRLY
jgi:hypothetical protein